MIYGQDEPMLFPVADLYDSGMMQMYINAAKEQYNQNREDMKEFMKTYGDFMSPFANDIAWVDQQTRGRINEAMRYLQENGIDPLRSAEGRAIIQNVINSVDRAGINQRRANAAIGEEYLKARGQLAAKGLYNSEYENWLLKQMGLPDFEHFDSSMGSWTRTSPAEYSDLNAKTSPWFDKLTPGYLYTKDGYDYVGIKDEDLQAVLAQQIPDFINSDYGRYQYELAKRQLQAAGNENPSSADITKQLKDNIVASNRELTARPTRSMNKEHEMALDYSYDMKKQQQSFRNQMALQKQQWLLDNSVPDENGKPVLQTQSTSNGLFSSASGDHTHLGETYVNAISHAAGTNIQEMMTSPLFSFGYIQQQNSALKKFGLLGGDFKKKAEGYFKTVDSRKAAAQKFMEEGSVQDAPGTIVTMFKGKNPTRHHTISISDTDASRLYSADGILTKVGGSVQHRTLASAKPISLNRNGGNRDFGMQPTGRIRSVYCADGRFRTFVEMNVYSHDKEDNKWGPLKNLGKFWYDTHITSVKNAPYDIRKQSTFGVDPSSQFDLRVDPEYLLELESVDTNVGAYMHDKAGRTSGVKFNGE